MKRYFSFLILLLLILPTGGCSCSDDSNAKKDEVQYKDMYKKYSPYDLWTVAELREKYDKAEKHSSTKKEILQKRIVLQGKIERVTEGTWLTSPYVLIVCNDSSDAAASLLFGGFNYRVWCYFSNSENMDKFKIDGWLIVEGRINDDNELADCKVIAALTPEDRVRLGFK